LSRKVDEEAYAQILSVGNEMRVEYVPTICPFCGCGCGIYLVVKDRRIVGVEAWKEHPVNEGKNCIKGRNAFIFKSEANKLNRKVGQSRSCQAVRAIGYNGEYDKGVR
jgi:predicted molibdopterin-dependent oxidoreductase YjgC